jgi:ferredoxin
MGSGLVDEKGIECCFWIGDPWASIAAEENPRFRKCSQEEALHVLKTCRDFGSVQMAYWRKELNRNLYGICNCCQCDCLGITAHNLFQGAIPVLAGSGYKSRVRLDVCNGCGLCISPCNFLAMTIDKEAEKAIVDPKKCMGCGVCKTKCPENAITLVRDPSEPEPVDLRALRKKYGH